jgi:hypothetical protein
MEYLLNRYETITKHTENFNITKAIGLTKFGSVMKQL